MIVHETAIHQMTVEFPISISLDLSASFVIFES